MSRRIRTALSELHDASKPSYMAVPTAGFAVWSLGVSLSHVPSPPPDQPRLIAAVDHPWLVAIVGGLIALVSVISSEYDPFALPWLFWGGLLAMNALAFVLMVIALDHGYSNVWLVLPFVGLFLCSMTAVLLDWPLPPGLL